MKLYDQVYECLRDHHETRDCDKALFIQLVQTHHSGKINHQLGFQYIRLDSIKLLPNFEDMARQRRRIQAGGEFPPSKECKRRRKKKEQRMKKENLPLSPTLQAHREWKKRHGMLSVPQQPLTLFQCQ